MRRKFDQAPKKAVSVPLKFTAVPSTKTTSNAPQIYKIMLRLLGYTYFG